MNTMNFFENIPDSSKEEIIEILAHSQNFRIERIISSGQSSPNDFWYIQEENEWVIVLEGEAELEFENNDILKMKSGDYLLIPALKKHRVKSTSQTEKTIWLAVFFN